MNNLIIQEYCAAWLDLNEEIKELKKRIKSKMNKNSDWILMKCDKRNIGREQNDVVKIKRP